MRDEHDAVLPILHCDQGFRAWTAIPIKQRRTNPMTYDDLLNVIEQVYDATRTHVGVETNPDITEGMNISLDLMESTLLEAGRFPRKEN